MAQFAFSTGWVPPAGCKELHLVSWLRDRSPCVGLHNDGGEGRGRSCITRNNDGWVKGCWVGVLYRHQYSRAVALKAARHVQKVGSQPFRLPLALPCSQRGGVGRRREGVGASAVVVWGQAGTAACARTARVRARTKSKPAATETHVKEPAVVVSVDCEWGQRRQAWRRGLEEGQPGGGHGGGVQRGQTRGW